MKNKTRNAMLAMAELYTRLDEIAAQIVKVDGKLLTLADERKRLVGEHESINAGLDAIGAKAGVFSS